MKQSKNTKRALTASILSMIVCCAMLIGSTFAWFTDNASTGVNLIQAGTLDVELQKSEDSGKTWTAVEENESLAFQKAADGAGEEIILEDVPEVNIVFTRKMLTNYQNEKVNIARWAEILNLAETHRAVPVGAIHITYHNNVLAQFFMQECDYEVHVQVAHPKALPEFKSYGGFLAATTYHVGGYNTIIDAHLRTMRWVYENDYQVAGNVTEEFIISPLDTTDESKYLTRIIIPIDKKD